MGHIYNACHCNVTVSKSFIMIALSFSFTPINCNTLLGFVVNEHNFLSKKFSFKPPI